MEMRNCALERDMISYSAAIFACHKCGHSDDPKFEACVESLRRMLIGSMDRVVTSNAHLCSFQYGIFSCLNLFINLFNTHFIFFYIILTYFFFYI